LPFHIIDRRQARRTAGTNLGEDFDMQAARHADPAALQARPCLAATAAMALAALGRATAP
jgi:hypothetical protein